jgi:hypothetical protein
LHGPNRRHHFQEYLYCAQSKQKSSDPLLEVWLNESHFIQKFENKLHHPECCVVFIPWGHISAITREKRTVIGSSLCSTVQPVQESPCCLVCVAWRGTTQPETTEWTANVKNDLHQSSKACPVVCRIW